MAIAAMKVLQERGIRIPDDVVIAGLNNEPQGHVITPPLTTGPLHFCEQGCKATAMILDLMNGQPISLLWKAMQVFEGGGESIKIACLRKVRFANSSI